MSKKTSPNIDEKIQQTILDLKEQLKAVWLEKVKQEEAAQRWMKHCMEIGGLHDERVRENDRLKEEVAQLKQAIASQSEAVALYSVFNP